MQSIPETTPTQGSNPTRNHTLTIILACCAGVVACTLLACAVIAGFWILAQPVSSSISSSTTDSRSDGLEALPAGNADHGEQVFNGEAACSACHSTSSDNRIVGPSLLGIGSRAAENGAGLPAEQYLYESITNPNAFVVDGYQAGIMPSGFGQRLSNQQLADLIAYLLTR